MNPLLPQCSFTFLFAQLFHPSLGPLGPIRRSLGFPTIFNVLGPLINPARPSRCILGVHSPGLGLVFANALKEKGMERAWVVCGKEGLDEISCEGETDVSPFWFVGRDAGRKGIKISLWKSKLVLLFGCSSSVSSSSNRPVSNRPRLFIFKRWLSLTFRPY